MLITVKRRSGSKETVTIKIPPGVKDGGRVRVPGKGDEGWEGGPNGDLFIYINVKPHGYFKREGEDIYLDCPITIKEALLGGTVKVPTIDGFVSIKMPPGVQSGQRVRIKGKGVYLPDGGRGSQYVTVHIVLPKKVDQRSKELIEEFGKINPYDPREDLW